MPLAFCLSGGIDLTSSLVSIATKLLNKRISTFSIIDEDERYNEQKNINLVNKDFGCDYNLIKLKDKKQNFFEVFKNLVRYHDGPISTISYFIHSFLSEQISKKGYKVSISGTGADELFTGYYNHFLFLHLAVIEDTEYFEDELKSWKKYISPNLRNKYLKDPFHYIKNKKNRNLVYETDFNLKKYSMMNLDNFKEEEYCNEILRNRMLNELFNEVVPVILKHDDLNSMFYSVENRSPYLDKNLLEFSLKIPPHLLIQNGYQKNILRESTKGLLNNKIRLNRQKRF